MTVESLASNSLWIGSGPQPGDLVLAWRRGAPEPGEGGSVSHGLDWLDLLLEQAPRGSMTLLGTRQGEPASWNVTADDWGARVIPCLDPRIAELHRSAIETTKAGQPTAALAAWQETLLAVADDPAAAAWMAIDFASAADSDDLAEAARATLEAAIGAASGARARGLLMVARGELEVRFDRSQVAREHFAAAVEIWESLRPESLALAHALRELGRAALATRDLGLAASVLERARTIEERLAPGSLALAKTLRLSGAVADRLEDLRGAHELYEAALKIRRRFQAPPDKLAELMLAVGQTAGRRGDLGSSRRALEEARLLAEKAGNEGLLGRLLNNLGLVAYLSGDFDSAIVHFERALVSKQKDPASATQIPSSLANLGMVALDQGELDRAEAYFRRAEELQRSIADGSLGMAIIANHLGRTALARGDFVAALDHHHRALTLQEAVAPESLEVAATLQRLGEVFVRLGDLAVARRELEAALALRRRLDPMSIRTIDVLFSLAEIARGEGRFEAAEAYFQESLELAEGQVGRLGAGPQTRSSLRATLTPIYVALSELLLDLGRPEAAFAVLERSRARSSAEMLAERELLPTELPPDLAARRKRLVADYDRLQRELGRRRADEGGELDQLLGRLAELRQQRLALVEELRLAAPRLAELEVPRPLDLEQIRARLDGETALLEFSVSDRGTTLFVVTRAFGLEVHRLAIGRQLLEQEVRGLREAIRQAVEPRSTLFARRLASLEAAGSRLFETLLGPARGPLAGHRRWLIVADGPLHTLPFGVLVVPASTDSSGSAGAAGRRYLVEEKSLRFALSASLALSDPAGRPPSQISPQPLIAFGDPRFGTGTTDGTTGESVGRAAGTAALPPLPGSRREVEAIAALFPASRTLLGEAAIEEEVKALSGGFSAVHFATHAITSAVSPLDSALVFSQPTAQDERGENGLLQVWEILEQLRFDADLVVLSACETSLGPHQLGEGLLGLARAFRLAGARSVVASLWRVPDGVTADFMPRFYHHLASGLAVEAALQRAQVETLRAGVPPIGWAAFQLYGESEPLRLGPARPVDSP